MTFADIQAAEKAFEREFGAAPRWVARAPGRVNLIGEHTDYNGGFVLPMALERETRIFAAPNGSRRIRIRTSAKEGMAEIDLSTAVQPDSKAGWASYPRGVVAGFLQAGYDLPGFDAFVHSTVPLGGGLSSSAALEVATATLLEAILGMRLDPVAKALLCQTAEHEFAGVPCGIMDQFVSTLGRKDHLLLLDCRSREARHIPLSDPAVAVLIINSNVRHRLASGEYAKRRAECERAAEQLRVESLRDASADQLARARAVMDTTVFRRARHIISETARTVQMADCVQASNWEHAGELMYESHESLQRDFEVSCVELDAIVETARGIGVAGGVYGCRMTGGGFGGCAVALIKASEQGVIGRAIASKYTQVTGITPTLFSSRPGEGAGLVMARGDASECDVAS